jgi:methylmalonyl-CoA/ethylmalonyl-CoA epimerase
LIQVVHHIGIAVRDLQAGIDFYRRAFGLEANIVEPPNGSTLTFAVVRLPGCEVELLAPAAGETPITKFLETRGEGVHHIAFQVEQIDGAMAEARDRGLGALSESALPGIEDTLTCFFHPRQTMGVLYEFVQPRQA